MREGPCKIPKIKIFVRSFTIVARVASAIYAYLRKFMGVLKLNLRQCFAHSYSNKH
ncbi:hypothetical protein GPUN_0466 [Glaciecola punicea ACAM 611]|uniref:Uncharacterized protein n=1 Tax=Glaciecola punicea ACAM 611 TaxID=1121923 RepID=H5T8H2_9ALTE|nr:hypothetical protein GPUN_0466 [Glaciecola punicea ACAM 611]